ncbi:omega-hydroxypalmitate O-feruloyl transferase [Dorcoceras hygrometricum]|uniref:Omega-hydroxypalmitate O-feruloyl transferase n=1 Tax=Dorcoceras hygrometricum TaxID=472368 RepID=A0A2Z7AY07_9LAMI|nr:omega-hydroxypalmitate O-feruloyl transferase [Dorcoceras hygrometricum]
MFRSSELPDCTYVNQPTLISPKTSTPNHTLYLSNLDDQKFLRFSIKYLYLFRRSIGAEALKDSLSRVLVEYYPLAGRLRKTEENDDHKLEVDCNGEGAVFAEAVMDLSADEFLEMAGKPNKSFRKLLYKVEASGFLDVPPLVVQVTHLRSEGMILCTAINHCLCDGIGSSQFLHAWAHFTAKSNPSNLQISPYHFRHVLKPGNTKAADPLHPVFTRRITHDSHDALNINEYLQSLPLVAASVTFSSSQILHLKKQCVPSVKCTAFDVLASHTWRCWVTALELPCVSSVKLLFSVNVRKKLMNDIPEGYYGNGFVLACAEAKAKDLTSPNLHDCVKLVQHAKSVINDEYVKSVVDMLEDKSTMTDLSTSFVISQWSKLGLEDVDFGQGKPIHMGPVVSDIYCLFLPVIRDPEAVTVLVSMPESTIDKFEYYMTKAFEMEENGDAKSTRGAENLQMDALGTGETNVFDDTEFFLVEELSLGREVGGLSSSTELLSYKSGNIVIDHTKNNKQRGMSRDLSSGDGQDVPESSATSSILLPRTHDVRLSVFGARDVYRGCRILGSRAAYGYISIDKNGYIVGNKAKAND